MQLEMFYLNSTLNLEIQPIRVFQLEVYNKVDRLLTGITALQKGTTAQWYSNKTSLLRADRELPITILMQQKYFLQVDIRLILRKIL